MKLLYFSPNSFGGLADYAQAQANAIADQGVEVVFLCAPDFPVSADSKFHYLPTLIQNRPGAGGNKLARGFRMSREIIGNHRILRQEIDAQNIQNVLFGAYAEYFAPLWIRQLKPLRDVRFGAVVHDPIRDTVRGPAWWHRKSNQSAYSILDVAFLHENIVLETGGTKPIRTEVIPHGPYRFPRSDISKKEARKKLGIPPEVPLLLQFGHLRNSKNLDLILDIFPSFPQIHLLVAGKEQSGSERPAAFYKQRAIRNNVADRCHWFCEHIPEEQVELFFAAADFLLLAYSRQFRSASGVLNASVQFRLPCLATSGEGPLRTQVHKYNLGIWREPDDSEALADGLEKLLKNPPKPRWNDYEKENAWATNARRVVDTFRDLADPINGASPKTDHRFASSEIN
ncbi:MAG TPA: glycosyltransferase family 4 protein [Opitutales bacterium]|nr:glycosyltransferase family 4 protein [Opitutales bacterium]